MVAQDCSYDATSECHASTLVVTEGDRSGETFTFETPADADGRQLTVGDDVKVVAVVDDNGTAHYSFFDYQRSTPMLLLMLLFFVH